MLSKLGLSTAAEDCAINEINSHQYLVTNIDIVTPIHDDPEIMGKIAACNVTNDLFAMNATSILNFSCFLGLPFDMPVEIAEGLLRGVRGFVKDLGADIHGGHTIQNPWPLVGGTASAILDKDQIIKKHGLKLGDRLIITKPLGIQAVMAAYRVLHKNPELLAHLDRHKIEKAIKLAEKSMTTSNRPIPLAIREDKLVSGIHAMTDVTGFGLKGHLSEMLQDSGLGAEISKIPIFPTVAELDQEFNYGILEGCGSEIAGAMLIAVDGTKFNELSESLAKNNVWHLEIGQINSHFEGLRFGKDFRYTEIEDY